MGELTAFEHAIDCPVPRDFAWRFWTNVENWKLDTDVVDIEFSGPFDQGGQGTTISRTSGRVVWRIVELDAEQSSACLETPLPGAMARFRWNFEDAGEATRMHQSISIDGEAAESLLQGMPPGMVDGFRAGMQKLCDSITKAHCHLEESL